jgi:uncharacterized protein
MSYGKPLPKDDPLMAPFWDLARQHKLSVQCCAACGDRHFPASPVCPVCLSEDQSFQPVSGKGKLVSWVTFHRAYWEGFELPYDVCLVKLDEGPLLLSNFMGKKPADLHEGLPVHAVFDDVTDGTTLPKFVVG